MGRYSVRGSAAFDALVDADMGRIARALEASEHAPLLKAAVLIGGYGRREGTPRLKDGREVPFNDYDLVVVSAPLSRRRRASVQADLRVLERRLGDELGLTTDLFLHTEQSLRRAEFSLLNYEMRYGHRVTWGDPGVIELMPRYPHDRIPLSEGTRLLLNRGKLLLDVQRRLRGGDAVEGEERVELIKFLLKARLAFGDCALLIHGLYDISYEVKKERIRMLSGSDAPDPAFLADGFLRAVAVKQWADFETLVDLDLHRDLEEVRGYYLRFLRWYEDRRLRADTSVPGRYLAALGRRGRECSPARATALNLSLFGWRALARGRAGLLAHPRARLYVALQQLLDESGDRSLAARVLECGSAATDELEGRFYSLQRRLS